MSWSAADARARFSELLHAAGREPQYVSIRGRRVAVLVASEEYEAFDSWRRTRTIPTLAQALDEVARACAEEDYTMEVPLRRDRPNPFGGDP